MYISIYLPAVAAVENGFINTNTGGSEDNVIILITTPLITPSIVNNAGVFKNRSVITKLTRPTIVYALLKTLCPADYNFLSR